MSVHFSSETVEWATPQDLFDRLNEQYNFTLDPCATKENAKCAKFYTKEDNGLIKSWAGERVFMNPPYGRELKLWIAKAHYEAKVARGLAQFVVALIPARTDTQYWHDYIWDAARDTWQEGVTGKLLKGRIKFGGHKNSAPFPSAIIVFK